MKMVSLLRNLKWKLGRKYTIVSLAIKIQGNYLRLLEGLLRGIVFVQIVKRIIVYIKEVAAWI